MSRFAEVLVTPVPNDAAAIQTQHQCIQPGEERPDDELDQGGEASGGGEAVGSLPIHFTEDDLRQGLLRGVPAHEIVAGAGKHWKANSQQSDAERSWVFSKPVRRNAAFISHSWAASRWLKWLALLMYFNGRSATIAAFVAAVAATLVDFFFPIDSLRFFVAVDRVSGCRLIYTIFPFISGNAVGAIVFFAGHHLRRIFEAARLLSPQTTFLDKLVIHQDKPELMQRGISLLGAFIHRSDVFLVLWSKEYLSRLWCSYEVAVFAFLKRDAEFPGSFRVLPLPVVMVVAGKVMRAFISGICNIFIMRVTWSNWTNVALSLGLYSVAWPIVNALSTAGMLELLQATYDMQDQVRKYDLRETQCFNPADRERVEAMITAWFEPRSRDKAIDKFNDFVRGDFQAAICQLFSESGTIHWTLSLAASLPMAYHGALATLADFPGCSPPVRLIILLRFVQDILLSMLVVALQFSVVRCIERCGRTDSAYAALPGAGAQSNFGGSSRRRPFVLHLAVCTLVDWVLSTLATYSVFISGPEHTIYLALIALLTLYVYW